MTIEQQIFEQIKKSRQILIILPEILTADSLASGLALRLFLLKLQKEVEIISSGQIAAGLKFLPGAEQLKARIQVKKSFVVTLDISEKKLEEISYKTESDKVHIFLKPKDRDFAAADVSFSQEKFPVDLVFVLDGKSLESLGRIYEQSADLFYEIPKINIDNKADNEYFGAINFVDVTATSVAEILAGLFQKYEQQLIDEDIATCLLTGIIEKTASFQHVHTTPKSFLKASELVLLGGRQQEVVKNIYKTKSLALLKLWGRALAKMKLLEDSKVLYSVLSQSDFEKAQSSEAEILPALKELVDNISGYKIVALVAESKLGEASIFAAVHQQIHTEKFLQNFGNDGKVLNLNFSNYKIVQAGPFPLPVEALEEKFLQAVNKLV